jgi:hypothetical protein
MSGVPLGKGASGPTAIPWPGRRPRRRPGVRSSPSGRAARRGRGPTPGRATVTDGSPANSFPADTRARATGHRDRLSFARCTIAWARRTYLLSASSRTLFTPSACSKASAAPLDRPSAVTEASASPANLSTSDWSSGGGWLSECSTIHASRCWRRWTTYRALGIGLRARAVCSPGDTSGGWLWWVGWGTQPQRRSGRGDGLVDDAEQFALEGVQVELVA